MLVVPSTELHVGASVVTVLGRDDSSMLIGKENKHT